MASRPSESMPAAKSRRRITIAFTLLVFVAAATLASRWVFNLAQEHDPLHGDSEEAGTALFDAMKPMKEGDKLPFLLKSVHDNSAGLRYAAVDSLGVYHTKEAADAIEESFRDSSSVVRQRAVETLHVVDPVRGMRLLLEALQDDDTWIRQAAITQLAMPRSAERARSVTPTTKLATDKSVDSEGSTVTPLADQRAVPFLIRALDDQDEVVARYAVALLHRITGQGSNFRSRDGLAVRARSIASWKSWWIANSANYPIVPEFANISAINPTRADPAPNFDLQDTEGQRVRLSAERGHVVLLNFWGTWCAPCKMEAPGLQRLHTEYHDRGLVVVGAAVSESKGLQGLKSWCAEHGLTFRQALATPELQQAYGHVEEVPISVMIDKKGMIRYRWEGDRDYATFHAAAERLLRE